jgi:putative two-component system response regulator
MNPPPSNLFHLLDGLQQQLSQLQKDLDQVNGVTSQQLHTLTVTFRKAFEAERQKAQAFEHGIYEVLLRVATALHFRDHHSGEHLTRMSQYSMLLALELGLPESQVQLVYAATPLYDVGKIGIPDVLLLKPGRLQQEERTLIEMHPTLGISLVTGVTSPLLETARQVILTHHEHWDGSGYPQGLKGEQIPVVGRIVMLAERYEALRCARPYRSALDHDHALEVLLRGDEKTKPEHFDPAVLGAFHTIHKDLAAIRDRRAS